MVEVSDMTGWHFVRVNRGKNVIINDVPLFGFLQVSEDLC